MSEDVPLYNGPTIVVTTDDGTLFSCTPVEMGGVHVPRQVRWQFIATDGVEYVGPVYRPEESEPASVQRIVSEWWQAKKALDTELWAITRARGKLDRHANDPEPPRVASSLDSLRVPSLEPRPHPTDLLSRVVAWFRALR